MQFRKAGWEARLLWCAVALLDWCLLLGVLICLRVVGGRFMVVVNSVGNVTSFCFVVILDCVF